MPKATQLHNPAQTPDATDAVLAYLEKLRDTGAARENWSPLLPFLFQLKGKPVTLHDYFPLTPLFNTRLPRETLYICGRQVAKSQSTCFGALLRGLAEPNYAYESSSQDRKRPYRAFPLVDLKGHSGTTEKHRPYAKTRFILSALLRTANLI